jgi:uncharacterized membrane protein
MTIQTTIQSASGRPGATGANALGSVGARVLEFTGENQLARSLGWFSVGLGLAEMLAPRVVAKGVGIAPHPALFAVLGMREITSGVGILTRRQPAEWLWSRVAGDVLDLALLGLAFRGGRNGRGRLLFATAAVLGVTALDVLCSQKVSRSKGLIADDGSIHFTKTLVINRPPAELYRFWRDFSNLPRFMFHLEAVHVTGDKRSHWIAKAPAGRRVEWDAEIIEERPDEMIAWRSLPGSDVEHHGSVRFERAPGGRGTVIRVEMSYRPPAGMVGAMAASLFGKEPGQQVIEDLRRFKQLMEAGEIITTEGQPAGRASSTSWKYDQTSRRNAAAGRFPLSTNGGAL